MISQLSWQVPNQVLYWKISGHITSIEIIEMSSFIAKEMANAQSQKVHLLIDTINLQKIDYQDKDARAAFALLAKHERMGKVVALIRDYQIQVYLNAFSTAFGLNWDNVTSMQAAIRSLKKVDNLLQTIPTVINAPLLRAPTK